MEVLWGPKEEFLGQTWKRLKAMAEKWAESLGSRQGEICQSCPGRSRKGGPLKDDTPLAQQIAVSCLLACDNS